MESNKSSPDTLSEDHFESAWASLGAQQKEWPSFNEKQISQLLDSLKKTVWTVGDKQQLIKDMFTWRIYMSYGTAALGEMILFNKDRGTTKGDMWFCFLMCCLYQAFDTTTCGGRVEPRRNNLITEDWIFLFSEEERETIKNLKKFRMEQGAHVNKSSLFKQIPFGATWSKPTESESEFKLGIDCSPLPIWDMCCKLNAISSLVIALCGSQPPVPTSKPVGEEKAQRRIPFGFERRYFKTKEEKEVDLYKWLATVRTKKWNANIDTATSKIQVYKQTLKRLLEQAQEALSMAIDPKGWMKEEGADPDRHTPVDIDVLRVAGQMAFSVAFCNAVDFFKEVEKETNLKLPDKLNEDPAKKLRNNVAAHSGQELFGDYAMDIVLNDKHELVGSDLKHRLTDEQCHSYQDYVTEWLKLI